MVLKDFKILVTCALVVPIFGHALSSSVKTLRQVLSVTLDSPLLRNGVYRVDGSLSQSDEGLPCDTSTQPRDLRSLYVPVKTMAGSEIVIATNDRNPPYPGVGAFGTKTNSATASVPDLPGVSGNGRVILTNAHAIFDEHCRPRIQSERDPKMPDLSGYRFFSYECGTWHTAVDFSVGTRCPNPSSEKSKPLDWAFVKLDSSVTCPAASRIPLASIDKDGLLSLFRSKAAVTVVGMYDPLELRKPEVVASAEIVETLLPADKLVQAYASGRVVGWNDDTLPSVIYYSASTREGGSGGPALVTQNEIQVQFAIHIGGAGPGKAFNFGVRLTPDLVSKLNAFASK